MKTRLTKAVLVAALAALAALPVGSAAAKNSGTGTGTTGTTSTTTTTSTTSGTTATVQHYCSSGYTLVGTTSTLYKSAYDANKNGFECVVSKRGRVSYADDFSQLL